MDLKDFRAQFPQYGDMSDQQLADNLYEKHYSDMPRDEFENRIGLATPSTNPVGLQPQIQFDSDPTRTAEYAARENAQMGTPALSDSVSNTEAAMNRVMSKPSGSDVSESAVRPTQPGESADPWYTALGKVIENAPDTFKQTIGNIISGASHLSPQAREAMKSEPPEIQAIYAQSEESGMKAGHEIASAAADELKKNQAKVDPGTLTSYGAHLLNSSISFAPALAAGVVAGPEMTLGLMSTQSFGDAYGESIKQGRTPDQATHDGLFAAGVNAATGALPVGVVLKGGTALLVRVTNGTIGGAAANVLQDALHQGYESGLYGADTPISTAAARIKATGIWDATKEAFDPSSPSAIRDLYHHEQETALLGAGMGAAGAAAAHPFLPKETSSAPPTDQMREATTESDTPAPTGELAGPPQEPVAPSEGGPPTNGGGKVLTFPRQQAKPVEKGSDFRGEEGAPRMLDEDNLAVAAKAKKIDAQSAFKNKNEENQSDNASEVLPEVRHDDSGELSGVSPAEETQDETAGAGAGKGSSEVSGNESGPSAQETESEQGQRVFGKLEQDVKDTIAHLDEAQLKPAERMKVRRDIAKLRPLLSEVQAARATGTAIQAKGFYDRMGAITGHAITPLELTKLAQQTATVAGQQVTVNTNPTEAQKVAGNYQKGHLNFQGLDLAIENLKGSERSGKSANGRTWTNEMKAHYGYVKRTEGADGDQVDVFLGDQPKSQQAYVIDQLRPDGKTFDEHKVMLGVGSEQEAEQLYRQHYPANWKGMGAITPMSMDDFKGWLKNGNTDKPLSWKPPVARSMQRPQAQHDSILEYLSKTRLHGATANGLNLDELAREGVDPADMKLAKGHGINRPFTAGGGTLDQAAEALHQVGYPVANEEGHYDKNVLLNRITDELRGTKHRSTAAQDYETQYQALVEKHEQALKGEFARREGETLDDVIERASSALEHAISERDSMESAATEHEREPGEDDEIGNVAEKAKPYGVQGDLLASEHEAKVTATRNALKKLEAERDRKRNSGQESIETGKTDDLFSQSRNQQGLFKEGSAGYGDTFHSGLLKAVEGSKQAKATPEQWRASIANLPGIKKEEIEWTGLNEWLADQTSPVTRQQLEDFVRANQIQVGETVRGGEGGEERRKAEDASTEANRKADVAFAELNSLMPPAIQTSPGYLAMALASSPQEREDWVRVIKQDGGTDELIKKLDQFHDLASETIRLNGITDDLARAAATKFDKYTLPGGENYHELMLTLPENPSTEKGPIGWGDTAGGTFDPKNFRGSHFDVPNILAHVRFNERTSADGKRTLFIEEIQSDWHQAGRKRGYKGDIKPLETTLREATIPAIHALRENDLLGFERGTEAMGAVLSHEDWAHLWDVTDPEQIAAINTWRDARLARDKAKNSVPDAPFKTSWPELAMKRMVRWAAEHGFDRIAWTPGEVQGNRYPGDEKRTQGMKAFYDKMLPDTVNKLTKKWGAKVGQTDLDSPSTATYSVEQDTRGKWIAYNPNDQYDFREFDTQAEAQAFATPPASLSVHSVDITPEMRAAALGGQALFEPRRAYRHQRMLPFGGEKLATLPTRPDSTPAQVSLGADAFRSLITLTDRKAGASVLASGLPRDFIDQGSAQLIGRHVESLKDLAQLAQVYRDPRFETVRVFFMRGNSVVHQLGITSRLPAMATFSFGKMSFADTMKELRTQMANAKADGYYLLHNHPSGIPEASRADIAITRNFAIRLPGFKGHIIIDQDKYGVVLADGSTYMDSLPYSANKKTYNIRNKVSDSDLVDSYIDGPRSLADIAKQLETKKGMISIVGVGARAEVKVVAQFPRDLIVGKGLRGAARLRRLAINGGASRMFAVADNPGELAPLLKAGILKSAINPQGEDEHVRAGDDSLEYTLGRQRSTVRSYVVREEQKPYDQGDLNFEKQGAIAGIRRFMKLIPENEISMSFRRILNPVGISDLSKRTANITRGALGELAHATRQAQEKLEEFSRLMDKLPIPDRLESIDAIEHGRPQPIKELQPAADVMRKILDAWRNKIQGLGEGYLENYIENYFPHYWQNQDAAAKAAQIFGRRPLRGPASFLKKRTIPTIKEGIEMGLKPLTTNPLLMTLLKVREMQRFHTGVTLMRKFREDGLARFLPATKPMPPEWREINDAIARVKQWSEQENGFIDRGKFIMPEDAARVINNHLSNSALRNFAPAQLIRVGSNALNALQLGFSGFHLGFTTLDAVISKNALGIERLLHGEPLRAMAAFGEAATGPIGAGINVHRGYKLLKAYLDPTGATPEMQKIVTALSAGGGRVAMDRYFMAAQGVSPFRGIGFHSLAQDIHRAIKGPKSELPVNVTRTIGRFAVEYPQKVWRDIQDMLVTYPKWEVPFEAAGRVVRASTSLIMEHIVPMQKLGVFSDLAADALRRDPTMSPEKMQAVMGKIWNSVDNRLGEMVYDNLFWNRTFKDCTHLSVRAVGWNYGTISEIGGAPVDVIKLLDKAVNEGKVTADDVGHKIPYVLAMTFTTALLGGILNYLMTGEPPKELKDYFFPRTGGMTSYGTPQRVSLPSYAKDVFEYFKHPAQTVFNKLNPIFNLLHEIWSNEDFFGGAIYNPDASTSTQIAQVAKFVGKEATPFSLQSRQQLAGSEQTGVAGSIKKGLPMVGISVAPGYIASPDQMEMRQHMAQEKKYVKTLNYEISQARAKGDKEELQRLIKERNELRKPMNKEQTDINKQNVERRKQQREQRKSNETSSLDDKVGPMISGKSRPEAVASLRKAGMPAMANLLASLNIGTFTQGPAT